MAFIARAWKDAVDNLLTLVFVTIRLQICPGLPDALGIKDAEYTILVDGKKISNGKTGANGEISILMKPGENLVLRVFDTDYPVTLVNALSATQLKADQKRLDILGYVTGYLLQPRNNAVSDDGLDGPMTRQSTINFQTDEALAMNSAFDAATLPLLKTRAGL